jgi:predicted permease
MSRLLRRLAYLLRRRRHDDELAEELEFHREMREREVADTGLDPHAVGAVVGRAMGNLTVAREAARDAWGWRWLHDLVQDTHYALRTLLRQPMFTMSVVATLALGVGVNTTMFSLVDHLMLRPPAHVTAPERLVHLPSIRNYRHVLNLRERAPSMEVAAYASRTLSLGRGEDARSVAVEFVSHNYFSLLGVQPGLGRWFSAQEETPGTLSAVAILSDRLWRRWFKGDPSMLGQSMWVSNGLYVVVGVAPPGFTGALVNPVDIWLPISANPALVPPETLLRPSGGWHFTIGRLRQGVTVAQAQAEGAAAELDVEAPRRGRPPDFSLRPFHELRIPGSDVRDRTIATWLAGAAALVLLIACANVAGLLLVRTVERRHEIAVRVQLGAGTFRIVRQLLAEAGLIAALCAAVSLLFLMWAAPFVRSFFVDESFASEFLDRRVLAVTAALAVGASLLSAIPPAWRTLGADQLTALKAGRTGSKRQSRGRGLLLAAQMTLTLALLVGAGLFVRSLAHVQGLDFGFDPDEVLVVSADLVRAGYATPDANAIYAQLRERARSIPGVHGAALNVSLPVGDGIAGGFRPPGTDPSRPMAAPFLHVVTPDYLATVGLRVVEGRGLAPEDDAGSPGVVLVSRRTADQYWPGANPLKQCLTTLRGSECFAVIGVVENSRWALNTLLNGQRVSDEWGPPEVFVAVAQSPRVVPNAAIRALFVRTTGGSRVRAQIIADLRTTRPDLPYLEVRSLWSLMDRQTRSWRLGAAVLSLFGTLAVVLAAVGVHGGLAFAVRQRTPEVGLRLALGARTWDIVRLIARDQLRICMLGCGLGAGLALALSRYLQSLLIGIEPTDTTTFVAATVITLAAAGAAGLVPAIRALRIDPAVALRSE